MHMNEYFHHCSGQHHLLIRKAMFGRCTCKYTINLCHLEALYSRVSVPCCNPSLGRHVGQWMFSQQFWLSTVIFLACCSCLARCRCFPVDHSSGQDLGILTKPHALSAVHGVCQAHFNKVFIPCSFWYFSKIPFFEGRCYLFPSYINNRSR